MSTIAEGKVVSLSYTLKNGAGEVLDTAGEKDALAYLHGADNIVPGLERALLGKAVGDRVEVKVPPAEGYGEKTGEEPHSLPRKAFPAKMRVIPGMQFMVSKDEDDEEHVAAWVTAADKETVQFTFDHPLAGETLHFDVTVVAIRDATEEEVEHGHPHGPDGHHHH